MLSSTSGHACLSPRARGGVQLSWRPWTITPGMPRSFLGAAPEQLAFLEPALVGHVMVLDPGDGDALAGSVKCSIISGSGSRVTVSPSHLLHALAARSCSSGSSLVSRLR
jgi:hypothetical protein